MNINLKQLGTGIVQLIIVAALLSSCVSQNKVKLIQEKVNKEMTTNFSNVKSTTYRVQIGDHLYIRVYSIDPKTSKFFQADFPYLMNSTYQYLNSYTVDEFGYINFSFIDKLYVKGMTIVEIKQALQQQLDEYFKDATAFVKLVNYQVAILGEVQSPGNFTVEQDQINVFQAIGLANGITNFGDYKAVKLIRQTQTGSDIHLLDLTDNRILESPYYYLSPNDVVYIEPRSTKSWAMDKFPYGLVISTITSLALTAVIYLNAQ